MAYIDLGAVAGGNVITSAWGNQVRANFEAGAVAAMAALGDMFIGTGADAGARLAAGADDSILVYDSGEATGMATQIVPAVRVYSNVAFDPTPTAWDSIDFTTERFDTDGMWALGSPSRLTVPAGGDGLYLIGGNFELGNVGGAGIHHAGIRILLDGATVMAQATDDLYRSENNALSVSCLYSLVAGNFVELQVYTTNDVNVLASSNYSPEFWAIWQRRP